VKRFIYFTYIAVLALVLATPVMAVSAADINSPQAQQLLQQLPASQQAQIQQAVAAKTPDTTVADTKAAVLAAEVLDTVDSPVLAKSALEKLYESRVLGNKNLTQLAAQDAPFFRRISSEKIPSMQYSQFGYDVFSRNHPLFQSTTSVDDNYILGPGDSFTVYLWGKLEERLDLVLDSAGNVLLPKSGPVQLAGVSFRNAGKIIQQSLAKHFVNFEIQVVFKERRNIQVYLLGQASHPGVFQVPAGTRLTGLLYLARGPLKEGALRKIQVLRNNRVIRTVDLYDYLLQGDRRQDVVLENEDTVLIPALGDTVLLGGTISRPGIYEFSSGDTVSDLVSFASGLTWDHYYKRVQIYRVQTGEFQRIEDVIVQSASELVEKTKHVKLKNGDMVIFHPIRRELRNVITAVGNVVQPGHYQWTPNMTLSTLIAKAEGMLPNGISRVDVYRFVTEENTQLITLNYSKPEDRLFKLKDWDVVQSYSATALISTESVSIQGSVKNPGTYTLLGNMRLQDLLFMAKLDTVLRAPEIDIVRIQSSGNVKVLAAAIDDAGMVSPNLILHPSDEVRVKTMRNPKIKVSISGEVRFPGDFVVTEKSRISDILRRAGGLTPEAYLIGTSFTRSKLSENESSGYDKVVKDEQKRLMYDQLQMTAFSEIDKQINAKVLEARMAYIQQLQLVGRQNKGRMVIDMNALVAAAPGSAWDVVLENGDSLVIPKMPDYIQVWGGVESPATYQYFAEGTWADYLAKAGGFSRYADRENIKVFHVNGTVSKLGSTLQPGDIVYVPENIEVPFNWMIFMRSTVDVLKTVSDAVFSFLVIKGLATGF